MPLQHISLVGAPYIPTSALAGNEPRSIYRGVNAVVRNLEGIPYIENYSGSKNLGENYTLTTLTGTIGWLAGIDVVGVGTSFTSELRPGQMILANGQHIVVNRVVSDTQFVAERALPGIVAGQTAYLLPVLFEIDKQRGVLLRGNAILLDRRDILLVGQGTFYLNGVSTGFTATRQPKRLERASGGTYSEKVWGFPDAPPVPGNLDATTGGWKGMLAGSYSFMVSYYNKTTDGFSNPSAIIKTDSGNTANTIAAGGRFSIDVTNILAVKPANADGLIIWGSLSGGGVTAVNDSNYAVGPWYEVARLPFTAGTIASVDTAQDRITVTNHNFKTGDYVVYTRTGGTTDLGGLTSGSSYWVMVHDANSFSLASSVANLKTGTAINLTGAGDGTQTIGFFDGTDTAYFEYLDSEAGQVATRDNNRPPECEWVTEFSNQIFYISCYGSRTSSSALGTSPGNFVVPCKLSNIESAPARWRVGVGEEITGFAQGSGRLFCLTRTGVPFVTSTGRTELARLTPTPLDLPFTARPFWTKGNVQPYSIAVVQGDIYAYTGQQPVRSPSVADERATPYELGRLIRDITKDVPDGHVLLAHDPKNQQVCIILSGVRQNSSGYWESEIIPLDLTVGRGAWQPKIKLTSTTADMIVSGAAYVNNRLEFLAGGRTSGGAFQSRTYRYDERSAGTQVDWSVVWQPSDGGDERKAKYTKTYRATGRSAAPVVNIYGSTWANRTIDFDDIESGDNSVSGPIFLEAMSTFQRGAEAKQLVKNLSLVAVRYSSSWTDSGSNELDRLDELVVGVGLHGAGQ